MRLCSLVPGYSIQVQSSISRRRARQAHCEALLRGLELHRCRRMGALCQRDSACRNDRGTRNVQLRVSEYMAQQGLAQPRGRRQLRAEGGCVDASRDDGAARGGDRAEDGVGRPDRSRSGIDVDISCRLDDATRVRQQGIRCYRSNRRHAVEEVKSERRGRSKQAPRTRAVRRDKAK